MKLRVARHTKDLQPVIYFYRDILGLLVLGEFKNHDQYNGVFLGLKNQNWHLEFTTSDQAPDHHPDKDDLLVFYVDSREEFQQLKARFEKHNVHPVKPANPYWEVNGMTYQDPDGFYLTISVQKPNSSF